jgi:hypothetical protein
MPQRQQRINQSTEHSIGVSFPTLCHILVYFLSFVEIHSKKGFRTVGLFLQIMGSSWRVVRGIVIFRVYSNHSGGKAVEVDPRLDDCGVPGS